MGQRIELTIGHRVNMLTVIKELTPRIRNNGNERRVLLCLCDCGNKKEILFQSVTSKRTYSCGCHQKKVVSNGSFAKTHGLSGHPIFRVWKCMKDRCLNKKSKAYKYYGGRGIEICKLWIDNPNDFYKWAIENGWKNGLQIDRKDNNSGYKPSNCRFVSRHVNMMNRRCTKESKRL